MKLYIKKIVNLLSFIVISPLFLVYFALKITLNINCFSGFSQFMSLFPGKVGSYLRVAFYRATMTKCEFNSVIHFGTLFSQEDTEISDGVYIGAQCNIGKSRIGKNTLIASGVHIMSGKNQHNFDDLETPIQQQGGVFEKITIGEDCWIGNGSLIMANIGNQCIVGAGSVVTKDVPDFAIVVGNPATVVRYRKGEAVLP